VELRVLQTTVAEACADLGNLKNWQERQNGSLGRIEKKVDQLLWRIIIVGGGVCLCLIGTIIEQAVTR
jgi:hypothetical protein